MKKSITFLMVVLFIVIIKIQAHSQTNIPLYHQHSDFLLTSPGSFGNGLLGYVNPALVNTIHGPDLRLMFSNQDESSLTFKRWGFFSGIRHLGFGFINHRFPAPLSEGKIKEVRITDYRIALGGGNEKLSFGLGYGWSIGDTDYVKRDAIWTLGTLVRPNRYFSIGLSSCFARHRPDREGVLDVAFRPLGSDFITLFSDFSLQHRDHIKYTKWSVGAVMQPLPGIHISGRLFNTKAFSIGLNFSLGAEGFSAQTHYDENKRFSYTTYGIRIGSKTHNIIDSYLKNDSYYLSMKLDGKIGYRRFLLFDNTLTLKGIWESLKGTIDDPRVTGVALNLSGMSGSREVIWEIREQLNAIRRAGKSVIIYLDRGSMTEYHLASVADRIVMDPEGMLILDGFVINRTYLQGTMEKLGLGFDEWRFFQYKSAYETYSRESMSSADLKQMQALIDDLYTLVRKEICKSRHFTEVRFDSLVNEKTLFLPGEAIREGLVDTLGRWKNMDKIIKTFEGEKKRMIPSKALAANLFPRREWGSRPKIALIYAEGVCDLNEGIGARKLEKILLNLEDDPEVKAVILRVDSPGGDGLASDLVAEAMRSCSEKKPVIVSQGNVAASGGYWISMNGDVILAGPNTITGSIGVIGGWVWDKGLGAKLGMTSDYVKKGKHADLRSGITFPFFNQRLPSRNLNKEERSTMEEAIRNIYNGFVARVAVARDLDFKQVKKIAQGRVWSGIAAKEIGLVDLIGGLDTAIDIAKESAGIPSKAEVDLIEFPEKGWINPNIFSPKLLGITFQEREMDWTWEYLKMISRYPAQPLLMTPPDLIPEK